jgi:hypothetical protein
MRRSARHVGFAKGAICSVCTESAELLQAVVAREGGLNPLVFVVFAAGEETVADQSRRLVGVVQRTVP